VIVIFCDFIYFSEKYLGTFICCYIYQQMATIQVQKGSKYYECILCDFKCSRKSQYERHLNTRKHEIATNSNNNVTKSSNIISYICDCGKEYKDRSGLWRHSKKCLITQEENTNTNNIIKSTSNDNELFTEKILETVMSQNKEFMNMFMTKMVEVIPQLGNNSHNTNCHNKTFNINMFLNEHCKNAMNLSDFIESLPITDKTYDNTIKNGLTNTITNMMVDGLNELDILERPIHCTDTKRKTIYVKENDVWEKDKELIKILSGIKKTALNNRMKLDKWQDANDGWMVRENIQMKYIALVSNVMTIIEDEDKEINKIINAIGKKVYLDESIKKEYL
jgi:hypothetical protein